MAAPSLSFIEELSERLGPVFHRYGVSRAILFGSFARGEPSPRSDLDLILVQETEKRFLERYDGLLLELGKMVPDRDLDVLIYTAEEIERIKDRPFVATALREGRVIYESA